MQHPYAGVTKKAKNCPECASTPFNGGDALLSNGHARWVTYCIDDLLSGHPLHLTKSDELHHQLLATLGLLGDRPKKGDESNS